MSDDISAADATPASAVATAGSMLRDARQAQGLHIAALAASIKVSQRKLELLEADRIAELPDATFARALAQTVCRSLKIDPLPVLAALPQASGYRLEGGSEGINKPFRDKPGRHKESSHFSVWASPALWAPALIVLAAAGLYFMPTQWVVSLQTAVAGAPAPTTVSEAPSAAPAVAKDTASANVEAASTPAVALPIDLMPAVLAASAAAVPLAESVFASAPHSFVLPAPPVASGASLSTAPVAVETVHSTPDAIKIVEASASGVAVGPLQVKAIEESWVEVVDAKSQVLVSRMLQRGETVVLDGAMPFKLKLGNAAGVTVALRGAVVDLAPSTRGNVARLELK
jgi:cytoskeleton protein RodZ